MRITFAVPDSMHAVRGGMKRIAEYASRLAKRGHDVVILSPDKDVPEWLASYRGTYKLANIEGYRHFETDVAIATGGRAARRIARMVRAKVKAYSVVMLESLNKPTEKHGQIIDRDRFLRDPYKQNWLYYANSSWLKAAVETKFGQKCHLVLAPSNEKMKPAAKFKPLDKLWALGYGHGDWKGAQRTADAVSLAKKTIRNLEMIHYSSRGMPSSRVIVKHWSKPTIEVLASIYSSADIFVHSSRFEGFANTCAEALSCGTPVVTYRTPGIEDIVIHGQTGIIVDQFEPIYMARAIVHTLTKKDLYLKLQENALRHMAQFTWDRTLSILEGMFQEALDEYRGRHG
jgi:D-inositol-3-phosphate glycosyltransferase